VSGGERQPSREPSRTAEEPSVLSADEPVASLGLQTAYRAMELLRGSCRKDRFLIVVSLHQVDIAREFPDCIIGLRQGRIIFDSPPQELDPSGLAAIGRSRPASPFQGPLIFRLC
jgi:phosphonate transport system ATP-binding protein